MAVYSGMTYKEILERTLLIAKKNGFELLYEEAYSLFNEAIQRVGMDVIEFDRLYSVAWPSNDQIAMKTNSILYPKNVYGDSKKLVYMDYESYRRMFLGDESEKPSIDDSQYWTILGRTIYLEPDIDDYTNVVVEYATRFGKIEDATITNEPELQGEYRILVCYKICEISCPSKLRKLFRGLYNDEKRNVITFKNRIKNTGQAQFWNPFEGGNLSRKSGWPGKITSD